MTLELPLFVVDTRESLPYEMLGRTVRRKLDAGDYSLDGYEHKVAVERKSHSDLWSSMSTGRQRFERCIERLAALDRAAIVVECSLTEVCKRPAQIERVNVASVVGGLVSYAARYNIAVFWCDNRVFAERVTMRYLASWYKHRRLLV